MVYHNTNLVFYSLEVRNLKWFLQGPNHAVWQGCIPSGDNRGKSLSRLSRRLQAGHIPWLIAASLQPLLPSLYPFLGLWVLYFPLLRTFWIHWAHLNSPGWSSHLKILHWIVFVKSILHWKVIYTGSGDLGTDIFREPLFCLSNHL